MTAPDKALLVWLWFSNALLFLLFAWDKFQAGRCGQRIAEAHLLLLGAFGGWPGGLLGMWLFRHKTAKAWFKWKYAAGFVV